MKIFGIYTNLRVHLHGGCAKREETSDPTQELGLSWPGTGVLLTLQHPIPVLAPQGGGWQGATGRGEKGQGIMVRRFEKE